MNTVTHKLYPISYIDNNGTQINTIYKFNPSHDSSCWVGKPIEIELEHPDLGPEAKAKKIAQLKQDLANLEADDEA